MGDPNSRRNQTRNRLRAQLRKKRESLADQFDFKIYIAFVFKEKVTDWFAMFLKNIQFVIKFLYCIFSGACLLKLLDVLFFNLPTVHCKNRVIFAVVFFLRKFKTNFTFITCKHTVLFKDNLHLIRLASCQI